MHEARAHGVEDRLPVVLLASAWNRMAMRSSPNGTKLLPVLTDSLSQAPARPWSAPARRETRFNRPDSCVSSGDFA